MNTITLKVAVTPNVADVTIELPHYCKVLGRFQMIVSESLMIVVLPDKSGVQSTSHPHIWFKGSEPCTREEFMLAYRESLENIEKIVTQS
jgi:hypothetical protein